MKNILGLLTSLLAFSSFTQIEGDNAFGTDQVLSIELTFDQVSFWDSLELNYDTGTYISGDVIITDITGSYSFPDVGVRLKGNSTYGHPGDKKSFKIDFNRYVSGQNYDGLKKLNFNNSFKDPSFIHEKIFFDMCNELNVPAPRANFADVFMNGQHWGFYSVVEQIDDQFLDWAIEDDDGNLFKAGDNFGGVSAPADLVYYGTDTALYTNRYELKTNETANDWTDLIELIDFINNTSDEDFRNGLNTVFDQQALFKAIAMDNLFSSLDTYLNSARNYYIYHNETTGKWQWIKWDGNETFGVYTGGPGTGNLEELAPNYIVADRPLVSRVFDDPHLYGQYLEEMCAIVETHFNSTYVDAKADALKTLIESYVYADANKQFTNAEFDLSIESNISVGGGPMGGTIYGVKSFVENRALYMDNFLDCATISVSENALFSTLEIFPNPCNQSFVLQNDFLNEANINIYNVLGKQVKFTKEWINTKTCKIHLNSSDSVCFVELEVRGNSTVRKIISK